MKNKSNYPISLDQMSEDDRTKFHLSAELDFDLSALISKIKFVCTLCTTESDLRFVKKILADLHDTCDSLYEQFQIDEHNESNS